MEADTQTVALTVVRFDTIADPWAAFDRWPVPDDSLESVEIGKCASYLPPGDPRNGTEDGFLTFMQEAWRCLVPGGTLTIKVLSVTSPSQLPGVGEVGDPLARRFFTERTFYRFGRPPHVQDKEDGAALWEKQGWTSFGLDFGTRFDILHISGEKGGELFVTMEKPDG